MGIPREDLEGIFEEFYHARNAKKTVQKGTGLRLPTVKRIVEDYSSIIQIQSQPDKGSKFSSYLEKRRG